MWPLEIHNEVFSVYCIRLDERFHQYSMLDHYNGAGIQQKVQVGMCAHRRLRSACASLGSQGFNVSSGGKLRRRSDCADAQTDLNLRCTHLPICTCSWYIIWLTEWTWRQHREDQRTPGSTRQLLQVSYLFICNISNKKKSLWVQIYFLSNNFSFSWVESILSYEDKEYCSRTNGHTNGWIWTHNHLVTIVIEQEH